MWLSYRSAPNPTPGSDVSSAGNLISTGGTFESYGFAWTVNNVIFGTTIIYGLYQDDILLGTAYGGASA